MWYERMFLRVILVNLTRMICIFALSKIIGIRRTVFDKYRWMSNTHGLRAPRVRLIYIIPLFGGNQQQGCWIIYGCFALIRILPEQQYRTIQYVTRHLWWTICSDSNWSAAFRSRGITCRIISNCYPTIDGPIQSWRRRNKRQRAEVCN